LASFNQWSIEIYETSVKWHSLLADGYIMWYSFSCNVNNILCWQTFELSKKGKFLFSRVSSTQDLSKRCTL